MSRILRVRTWRVTWFVGAERVDVAFVEAPTKTRARLNLVAERPDLVCRNRNADRVAWCLARDTWSVV